MDRPLLTVSILISGRESTTERCLESLRSIMDGVDTELILVDTGCQVSMRQEVEKYATKVIPFQWCNDFSKARNAGLKEASGQWFLYLDDDEWFVNTQDLIAFFKSGEYKHYTSASYIQRNYLDLEGSQYTDTRVGRMACIAQGVHFEGKIHEYLTVVEGRHKNLSAMVDHYGYVYLSEEDKRAHFRRNQKLLEEMIVAEPMCLRWRLQLLQEYRTIDDYIKMEKLGTKGVEMLENSDLWDRKEVQIYIGSFYAARILAADGRNNYDLVYQLSKEAMNDKRNTKLCTIFLYQMLSKACFYRGMMNSNCGIAKANYEESEHYAQAYLEGKKYFIMHSDEFAEQQIAPFVGECLDEVKQKEIYSIRICNGLKMENTDNLSLYVDLLQWNEKHAYVFEEIINILIVAMNHFGNTVEMKNWPENCDFEIYAKTLRIMHDQHALWEYFCELVTQNEDSGIDMRGLICLIGNVLPSEVEVQQSSDELEELTIQIKQQIRLLVENGMRDQARTALEQVKKILPNDFQLGELEQICK